ncbi:DUF3237 domain-containing protein [Flavisphingomonas formosensis]|uniref:DUF3237 domain-containing protein n=1 Tax=Flavisphingomonas formosensis TaxID=861534 RepID=UPI0012FB6219|nr:DUF3237 domain-containing protein [Sphingomonas formosensis]
MDDFGEAFAALGELRARALFVMKVGVDHIHAIGGPAGIDRRVGEMVAGRFAGERLSGDVLTGGADWQIVRADGAILLDARVVLRTYDGAEIAMEYTGIRTGPADIIARLGRGELVDPADYYFRIAPRFSTSDPRYEWLNRIMAVGIGHRLPEGPVYSVFEIV